MNYKEWLKIALIAIVAIAVVSRIGVASKIVFNVPDAAPAT